MSFCPLKNTMAGQHQNISNDHNEERDRFSGKPALFDGENFDYWKDRIESFFLAHNADLGDRVTDGYTHPVNASGQKIDRKACLTNKSVISRIITRPELFFSVLSLTLNMKKYQTEIGRGVV